VWLGWLAAALGLVSIALLAFGGWELCSGKLLPARARRQAGPAHSRNGCSASGGGDALLTPPQPSVPGPAAAPVAASINALLAANSAYTSDATAFRRLLSLWGTAMADDKNPCGQAAKAGLSCLEQRGSWAQVRALNRPAILTLTDDHGQRHRVVLSALDDRFATFESGRAR